MGHSKMAATAAIIHDLEERHMFGREWECAVGAPRGLHSDQDSRAEQEQEEAPAISTPDPWADSTPALGLSADELVELHGAPPRSGELR